MSREPIVRPEIVTIGKEGIDRSIKLQEQQSQQRHQYNLAMNQFHAKQAKYAAYIKARKALLQMEKELAILEKPVEPVVKKKSRPHMILESGEWKEVEGIVEG